MVMLTGTGSVPEIAFDSTINTSSIAYTVNNRKIANNTGGSFASTRVTKSKSSGKWYFEMYYNDSSKLLQVQEVV